MFFKNETKFKSHTHCARASASPFLCACAGTVHFTLVVQGGQIRDAAGRVVLIVNTRGQLLTEAFVHIEVSTVVVTHMGLKYNKFFVQLF